MKMIIDVKKTYGNLIYLGCREWLDYKTKTVKGVKVYCGAPDTFEKLEIRAVGQTKEQMAKYSKGTEMNLDFIVARFWTMNGKSGITLSMESSDKDD